ncbi:MAG: hypothetical protein H7A25_19490 [Leptospiraceae bacterium]|nr:hypothetical protein [Leptospiraceae bacterium]MCP5502091.1 hypothetical protein [Leptospiraceae bacterium]
MCFFDINELEFEELHESLRQEILKLKEKQETKNRLLDLLKEAKTKEGLEAIEEEIKEISSK